MYTKEQLETMPLHILRNVDIRTSEEEKMVQELVNQKLRTSPLERAINRSDVPDIKDAVEEAYWQKIIDARTEAIRPKAEDDSEPLNDLPPEEVIIEPTPEVQPDVPVEVVEPEQVEEQVTLEEVIQEEPVPVAQAYVFCPFCTSKGVRHKKECNRPQ